MNFDNFNLDEKAVHFEDDQAYRRDSEIMMREAIISKKDELRSYNKLLRLYGAESPLLQANNPHLPHDFDLDQSSKSIRRPVAVNKILETKHNLSVENRILNFFIFIATVFLVFQFSLIAIIKLDIELPTLSVVKYETFFHYAYFTVLVLGKCLIYLLMTTFFARIYIGVRVFKQSVNTNILLKLINLQFIGFLSASLSTVAVIAMDVLVKLLLTNLEIVEGESRDHHFNGALSTFRTVTGYLDLLFYVTIVAGVLLAGVRKVAKWYSGAGSIELADDEKN